MVIRLALIALATTAGCKREAPAAVPVAAAPVAMPQAAAPEPAAATNAKFPSLKVTSLDGNAFDLAAQRGKWAIVNFWATWCGPCLKEMPELSALDAMREHIVVVGLAYEDTTEDALRAFLVKHPVVYPMALIDVYNPPADFDTPRGLPFTYLIGPDGAVVKKYTGPVSARMLEEDIAAAGGPTAG
ncbi:TlpA family protein disulfide reductase [Thermomonas carbonis]|uniref:TlpA family protein disulfide reductase n=1 Tax=Thermomonas carbonis TaxID=1463158 RepID=UPI003CCCA3C6